MASGAQWRDGAWHNDDVDSLMSAASVKLPQQQVCPYLMQTPAAPHIVAQQEGVRFDAAHIHQVYRNAAQQADAVIVEGVGGFCVPLQDDLDTAMLARTLNLPVILVVGLRLGCINHALLTAEAIAARGLRLAGWVANTVDAAMLFPQENLQALQARLPAPLLGHIPRLTASGNALAQQAAACLHLNLLK